MVHKATKLARFLKPYRKFLALAFLGALGEAAADLLQPWPLKILFDHIFGNAPLSPGFSAVVRALFGPGVWGIVSFSLVAVLAVALLNAASSFTQDFFMPRIGHWVLHDLRRQLYWQIQRLSIAYHDDRRMGDLLSTLTTDIQAVRELIESALLGLLINSLTLAGMVAVMLMIDWRFALLALSITPILFAIVYRFTRQIKEVSRDVRRREGAVASVAQEVLSSIRVVQAFTREEYEQARFERENQERVSAGIRARTLQAKLKPMVELLTAVGTTLVLWYGARQVLAGSLSPGSLIVFLAYLSRLYRPMRDLAKQADILSRAEVGLERILNVLETDCKVKDLPGARSASKFRGAVEFENVSFSYRPGIPVLRSISFRLEPGQVVALVGTTGAGKTTLVSLLPRFNDPDQGCIRVDEQDVRRYTLASLRSQMSLVLQETILFYGTVRDNIAYGRPEATLEEIVAAATAANAHEFIDKLPEGYETMIGERGVTLSGGQRQRLAIARAIIRDAPIILLDEPTTGLDASSEALVMEGLARLMAGRTTIVIAHRLTTISRADIILVLEHGKIIESGTHADLFAAGGRYAELYELQFRGQAPVTSREGLARLR
ncbi:MAG: ABC transporter ATP-binding protein [Acidobacteria bacterium]|nr:ABC transporter ATP-binding protein [Acidobacteriota bacterium]MBI3662678.1 ABC transporter ATP-binding protein [Acidobacteriota bacterium]